MKRSCSASKEIEDLRWELANNVEAEKRMRRLRTLYVIDAACPTPLSTTFVCEQSSRFHTRMVKSWPPE
jgi:hypothetical protein